MLTDYVAADERIVACPNQDVAYGGGSVGLELSPVVLQVPDFGTRIQSEYLRGVGNIDGRFALFLDTERLLSPAELLRITTLDDSQPVADGSTRDASTRGGSERPPAR